MLIVEGIGKRTAPSSACAPLGPYPLGTAENRRVAPTTEGAGSHVTRFLFDCVCVSARRGYFEQRSGEHLRFARLDGGLRQKGSEVSFGLIRMVCGSSCVGAESAALREEDTFVRC